MTFIGAYFPKRSEKGYRNLVSEMFKWIDGVLKDTPKRSTPFLGGDINDGIGFQRVQGCWQQSDFCGDQGTREKHGSGTALRETLHKHGMGCTGTYNNVGPTYFGHN